MIKNNLNIVEELKIEKECIALAKELCLKILAKDNLSSREIVIAIGGESGSGKSSTALSLQNELSEKGLRCLTLHMDSYFKLPPKDNHRIEC